MANKRTTAPQDDSREQEQLRIFGLRQDPNSTRGDNDALLDLEGHEPQRIELKTTTTTSLTTARDFGVEHIKSWRGKHILASFYDASGQEIQWSLLIPSVELDRWLNSQMEYVELDLAIIKSLDDVISDDSLDKIRGSVFPNKNYYTLDDLKRLLKKQIDDTQYDGYIDTALNYVSESSMNRALKERVHYLISRGVTRNNPHINKTFIQEVMKKDPKLKFDHQPGNYQAASQWLIQQLGRYPA